MNIFSFIKIAAKNLFTNWKQTFFSLLGVVIGACLVFVVFSLGEGLKRFVLSQVEVFGTDIIEVEIKTPKTSHTSTENTQSISGGGQIKTLKIEDAEEIAKNKNIFAWYGAHMSQRLVEKDGKGDRSVLMGVSEGIVTADKNFILEEGRIFSKEESRSLKQVVILGSKLKNKFFGDKKNAVGENLKIGGKNYQVIGVLKERGGAGFLDFDKIVYLPIETLQKRIAGIDYITFAIFKVKDAQKIDSTAEEIKKIMTVRHKIKKAEDEDFAVMSIAEAIKLVEDVFKVINYFLLGLTSLSLVVGGVGIMNVMYVSVTERSFEIGLKKAVGARKIDIMTQFIIESSVLTFFGGLIGVLFGFIIVKIIGRIIENFNLFFEFNFSLVGAIWGLSFSMLVGIFFGIYPAKKATELSPAEALKN